MRAANAVEFKVPTDRCGVDERPEHGARARCWKPAAFGAVCAVALAGGASAQSTDPWAGLTLEQIERPTHVVMGTLAVVPVRVLGPMPESAWGRARLDDGREVSAHLCWIGRRPAEGAERWTSVEDYWLIPSAESWTVVLPPDRPASEAEGGEYLIAQLPLSAGQQGITVGRTRLELAWHASPVVLSGRDLGPWLAAIPQPAVGEPWLERLSIPLARSPLARWRVRLLFEGLAPTEREAGGVGPAILGDSFVLDASLPIVGRWPALAQPQLEALAMQSDALWQVALVRLWRADRGLHELVVRTLARVARFDVRDQPLWAPVWDDDALADAGLLRAILSARGNAERRDESIRAAAAAWLAGQNSLCVWLDDPGGAPDVGGGDASARIGLLRLADGQSIATASVRGHSSAAMPIALEARVAQQLDVPLPSAHNLRPAAQGGVSVEVSVDGRPSWLSVSPSPIPAEPPGLALWPFVRARDRGALVRGDDRVSQPQEPGGTSALLQLAGAAGPSDAGQSKDLPVAASRAELSWRLFVECAALTVSEDPSDALRLWLGPSGAPAMALRIERSGRVTDVLTGQDIDAQAAGIVVLGRDRAWSCIADLPGDVIATDGTLRIGIERVSRAGRSSLGAAMFPWQTEPPRVAVDTSAWERAGR